MMWRTFTTPICDAETVLRINNTLSYSQPKLKMKRLDEPDTAKNIVTAVEILRKDTVSK